jgi:hypothetical protein
MKTNFQFGISQINKPTPLWAKYTFRIVFLLLSVAIFMVSDYPGMNEGVKLLLLKWFSGINMLVWGLSKMVMQMTQQDITIIDKQLRGINLRLIWALVVCTAVSVSTVLSVYYGFRNDIAIQKIQIKLLEARVDRIENNKTR